MTDRNDEQGWSYEIGFSLPGDSEVPGEFYLCDDCKPDTRRRVVVEWEHRPWGELISDRLPISDGLRERFAQWADAVPGSFMGDYDPGIVGAVAAPPDEDERIAKWNELGRSLTADHAAELGSDYEVSYSAMPERGERHVLADRVHHYEAPIELLFYTLTVDRAGWLGLQPGEIEPQVLEATKFDHVVWSSFWPVSPDDTIEFDLSPRTSIRFRWHTYSPPDARGIGITRQRLNRKFGGNLRSVVSDWYYATRRFGFWM